MPESKGIGGGGGRNLRRYLNDLNEPPDICPHCDEELSNVEAPRLGTVTGDCPTHGPVRYGPAVT